MRTPGNGFRHYVAIGVAALLLLAHEGRSQETFDGDLKKWHPVTVSFMGPYASEMDSDPNPFLDFRLIVTFMGPGDRVYRVPGFFDGDGEGGGTGNVWKVRFAPDEAGTWNYRASFRTGNDVAVDFDVDAGEAVSFDGSQGSFDVGQRDPGAPGFLKWGRLEYVGGHYLRFRDGPYWIKGGTDSPENFLGYAGFENTRAKHRYTSHIEEWDEGDPDWNDGKGKGIIGLINYLSSKHVNSIYFLPMNIGGDGKDVWPFTGPINPEGDPANDNLHYDVGKLAQWEVVFQHAQKNGIHLHFVLNEAEEPNKRELDNGELGVERKLFYREMIARFGHHNALQWNIFEEYDLNLDLGPGRVRQFADYIEELDPYAHPITVHNKGRDADPGWRPFLGDTRFSLTSFQFYQNVAGWGQEVKKWRRLTSEAGRPLPICLDELKRAKVDELAMQRKEVVWPTYFSGGNVEFILHTTLETDDLHVYEDLWMWTWYARKFMEENLPF